jgi:acetolactate synthase I/II/III large subunit
VETVAAGRAIVDVLRAEGVRFVYGMPGGHVLSIYDALFDAPEIEHVLVRHEQAAASMAAATAQLTGEPGVCLVTAGPGATNLLSGIAEAYVGCLPIVILSGRGATATALKGASQEVATDRIFAPVTKWTVRVDRADQIVGALRQGFAVARSGKPGPVLIDLPRDLVDSQVPAEAYESLGPAARPPGDPAAVRRAASALATAERPLLIAGGGCAASSASAALIELAELLAIPVLSSLSGRGQIPEDHPLSGGGLGAHRTPASKRLLAEADVVVALGFRWEEMETTWRPGSVPAPGSTHIQVDIDPAELGRSVPAQIPIAGDVRAVLEQLLGCLRADDEAARLAPGAFAGHPRALELADALASVEADVQKLCAGASTPMHPLRAIRAARAAFPRETTLAVDVGCLAQHMAGASPYFRVFAPRSTIVPSSFYGMGFATAALPAARLVHPDRPALAFTGDGSFALALNILPVAAERRLGVTWCVLDDGALGSIRDIQVHRFDQRILATEFPRAHDFAAIATACGCHGERVQDPEQLAGAFARALEANERGVPAVVDVAVAPERVIGTLEHYTFYPPPR